MNTDKLLGGHPWKNNKSNIEMLRKTVVVDDWNILGALLFCLNKAFQIVIETYKINLDFGKVFEGII